MFCNNCGKELRDIDAFCSSCGKKVSMISERSAPTQPLANAIALLKASEWSTIDGELCRVTHFATLGSVVDINGNVHAMDRATPYAYIDIECNNLEKM